MISLLRRWIAIQRQISEGLGRLVSWACLVMIAVILYEVSMRYLFMRPTDWAHELSTMLYGGFCLLAGVYTQKHNAHVRCEVFYQIMPPRMKAAVDCLTGLAILAVLLVFFVLSWDFAARSWAIGEFSSRSTWQPPVYPLKSIIPLTVGLMFLQRLADWVTDLLVLLRIQEPKEAATT